MADIHESAEKDYIAGMKYREIAKKYGVTENTVKSWKTRYKWIRGNKKKQEKECAHKNEKSVHTKSSAAVQQEEPEKVENYTGELTEKMQLFCVYFVKSHNATKAYMKAYQCGYQTAAVSACRLLKNDKIRNYIDELKDYQMQQIMLKEEDVVQKYIDIAFADVNDFVEIDPSGMWVVMKPEIDGTIVNEIKNTKHGISIKLNDRMRALKELKETFKEKLSRTEAEEKEQKYGVVMLAPVLEENLDEYDEESIMDSTAEAN